MEKETLASYQAQLLEITAPRLAEEIIFVMSDTKPSWIYGNAFRHAQEEIEGQKEKRPSLSEKPPLLILTDTLSRTGRWAMAADSLGFRGIVFYAEGESEDFLLTYFGNDHFTTIPQTLSALALPNSERSRAMLASALTKQALAPEISLLEAIDLERKAMVV